MNFIKTKNTALAATFVVAIFATTFGVAMPVAAQNQNDLLPPPLLGGQTSKKAASSSPTTTPPTVEYLSDDTLQQAFEKAIGTFGQDTTTPRPSAPQANQTLGSTPTAATDTPSTPPMPIANHQPNVVGVTVAKASISADPIPIGQVRLNVALENMPLENVMDAVMHKVSERTGKWEIRWRLNGENQRIRNERVNINAETDFDTFMGYLMERVNNMTGIQLFVKVFEGSRLIIIADNY